MDPLQAGLISGISSSGWHKMLDYFKHPKPAKICQFLILGAPTGWCCRRPDGVYSPAIPSKTEQQRAPRTGDYITPQTPYCMETTPDLPQQNSLPFNPFKYEFGTCSPGDPQTFTCLVHSHSFGEG